MYSYLNVGKRINTDEIKLSFVNESDILNLENYLGFNLPKELKMFFKDIGCGYINQKNTLNIILSPEDIIDAMEKNDHWAFDPSIEDLTNEEIPIFLVSEYKTLFFKRSELLEGESNVYDYNGKITNSFSELIQKTYLKEIFY